MPAKPAGVQLPSSPSALCGARGAEGCPGPSLVLDTSDIAAGTEGCPRPSLDFMDSTSTFVGVSALAEKSLSPSHVATFEDKGIQTDVSLPQHMACLWQGHITERLAVFCRSLCSRTCRRPSRRLPIATGPAAPGRPNPRVEARCAWESMSSRRTVSSRTS